MLIPLRLKRDQQLQQQIFDQLQDLIVSGRLQAGARMPSSRMMAEQFTISRMTVLLAYERLIAEGYLETRPAAGTFVARLQDHSAPRLTRDATALSLVHPPANSEPERTPQLSSLPRTEARVSSADPSLFPARRWRSLMRQGVDRIGAQFGPEDPAGNPALRDAIAGWLSSSRGLPVAPDQLVLVRGRQQAFHMVARLASHPCEGRHTARPSAEAGAGPNMPRDTGRANRDCHHSRIVVEDPCDADAAAAMAGRDGALVRIPVDADGLRTDRLPEGSAALIHVTPEHQRPLGAVMSIDRRAALLVWAAQAGALILEEDIDGELHYGNTSVPSLMSLDRSERVIMLGGFGSSLGPWLDIAYLVLPHWLVPYARAARRRVDESRGGLEHTVLAEYLESGGYARHLHRLTKAYASRRDALLAALQRHFGDKLRIQGQQSGLHVAWFPAAAEVAPASLAASARRFGLQAAAVGDEAVLLGFGMPDEQHIATGIRRLADALVSAAEELPPIAVPPHGFAGSPARGAQL